MGGGCWDPRRNFLKSFVVVSFSVVDVKMVVMVKMLVIVVMVVRMVRMVVIFRCVCGGARAGGWWKKDFP